MNIDYLPSQLHMNYRSKVDISLLLSIAEGIFPDMGNAEVSDDILNLYEPNELIEFIHVSKHRIGVIFSEDIVSSNLIETAWKDIAKLLSEMNVSKLEKFKWEYKLVKLFKSKTERETAAKKMSPARGYQARVLVLYPDDDLGYFVRLSMVSKDNKKHGIMFNFTHEIPKISLKDILQTLEKQIDKFKNIDKTKVLTDRIIGK